MILSQLAEAALSLVYPPRCGVCQTPLSVRSRLSLCAACEAGLVAHHGGRCRSCDLPGADLCARCTTDPPPFARLRAPYIYEAAGAELLQRAKFQGRGDLAAALGLVLADDAEVASLVRAAAYIVPVPLGRRRAISRGFNQSAIIARVLARRLDVPLRHALRRRRDSQPQSELQRAARADNVREAFVARLSVAGRVVLVDDVVTSTETARAAAAALRKAGAAEVRVVAPLRAI